ncbi:MAG: fructose-6-phosphate aldolase [Firmicutes bacterium]|nr:fructose-6-phosphate aldolase [Bacillota bacterium]HOB34899.1 fructose-6-phosphate aldolase [Bacillota bacterium]HQE02010.1 fructose-6-phosphate aldolase [Bacillota bacterium]
MRFFIDTANVEQIREAWELGVIEGVTTNPTLVAREGKDFQQLLQEIIAIVDGPISAEVISLDSRGMVDEALALARLSPNIVIKIPMTAEGLKATKILTAKGIKTNVTLIFSLNQAVMAARAGATYVSPFVGRLDDVNADGIGLVRDIVDAFAHYGLDSKIIAASIRNVGHIADAIRVGAHYATVPYDILLAATKHPLTDQGIARFLKDWEKLK